MGNLYSLTYGYGGKNMWQEALKWALGIVCIVLAVLATMRANRIKSQLPPMDAEVGIAEAFVVVAGYGAVNILRIATLALLAASVAIFFLWQ